MYTESIVTVNGTNIEKFYFLKGEIVFSKILFVSKTHEDAENNFMGFWEPKENYSIPHTINELF